MIIVLIHWRIKPDCEAEFQKFWSEQATIADRPGLISEFLSKVEKSTKEHCIPWLTWHVDTESFGDAIHYVNVALWDDEAKFEQQIGRHFNDDGPMRDFEKY